MEYFIYYISKNNQIRSYIKSQNSFPLKVNFLGSIYILEDVVFKGLTGEVESVTYKES